MVGTGVIDHVGEKWGGLPHYEGFMHVLGDDEHGTWLWGPMGRTISRGGVPVCHDPARGDRRHPDRGVVVRAVEAGAEALCLAPPRSGRVARA